MKRIVIAVAIALMGIMALPAEASAQFDLSKLLGGSSNNTSKKSPYQTLAENAPQKKQVVGTWSYEDFNIEYLGSNSFATTAISQVESYGRAELVEAGVTPGCFTIKLNANGTGSFCYEEYVYEGRYNYDSATARFMLSATADNGKNLECGGFLKMTPQGKLVVMFKAEDAVRAFKTVLPDADDDSTFEMIEGVVQSFPGIYLSMRCTR